MTADDQVTSQAQPKSPHRLARTPVGEAGGSPAGCSTSSPVLRIAPCSRAAARYAVENWHYTQKLPSGGLFTVGVWEDRKFVGCVIFSRGANGRMGKRIGLNDQRECVELTRIALDEHHHSVTHILKHALRELREHNPRVRGVMSYADPEQGHHGGIYQGGGWSFIGLSSKTDEMILNGQRMHLRSVNAKYGTASAPALRARGHEVEMISPPRKYVYALGFDRKTRNTIKRLSKTPPGRHDARAATVERIDG